MVEKEMGNFDWLRRSMRKGDILRKLKYFWWNIIKAHSAKERVTKTERKNKNEEHVVQY